MNFFQKIYKTPYALRGYLFGDPERNGEYRFLRRFVKPGMVVFDVGAHVGDYARELINITNGDVELHCFEPVQRTFDQLRTNLQACNQAVLYLNNFGLSSESKNSQIYIYGELSGNNSLHMVKHKHRPDAEYSMQHIKLMALDEYVDVQEIKCIDFLKIDVEGHEPQVIKGAMNTIKRGAIRAIQFENNYIWKETGQRVDILVKELLANDYQVYRLTPWGKLNIRRPSKIAHLYPDAANYVAVLRT